MYICFLNFSISSDGIISEASASNYSIWKFQVIKSIFGVGGGEKKHLRLTIGFLDRSKKCLKI